MDAPRSMIVRDSIHTFGIRVLNMMLAAVLGIVTARFLGPALRGIYVLPVLDAALAGALISGLQSATSYYMLSERRGNGVLRPAFATGGVFVIAGSLLVAALGFLEQRPWTILPAAVSLIPTALTTIAGGYALGKHRVEVANYFSILTTFATLLAITFGMLFVAKTANVAVEMWLVATIASGILAAVYVRNGSLRSARGPDVEFRSFLAFAAKAGSSNILTVLNLRVDVYIIAALTSAAALGVYTVAVSGAETLKILTLVLSQSAGPKIGSIDRVESASFTSKCVRNNLLIAIVPCALIIALGPYLLQLLYGPKFLSGGSALQILAIGVFASAPSSLLAAYYTLKLGRPMVGFWINALSAAICAALSFALIPRFGMNGAASASTIAYVVSQGVMLWIFIRDTRQPLFTVLFVQRDDLIRLFRVATVMLRRIHT